MRADAGLRRDGGELERGGGRTERPRRDGWEDGVPPVLGHADGDRGQPGARAAYAAGRGEALLRDVVDGGSGGAAHGGAGGGAPGAHEPLLADVAGGRRLSGPPVAVAAAALGADVEGPHVHAHGGAGGGGYDLAAGDPAGVAQLGLPVLLDAGRDVHPVGPARAGAGLGGGRLRAVSGGPGAGRGWVAADHVRDQGGERARGVERWITSRATRTRAR